MENVFPETLEWNGSQVAKVGDFRISIIKKGEEPTMPDLTATVQELYAAFGRGDIPAILAKLADDVVWESEGPAIVSFSGIRHGKTAGSAQVRVFCVPVRLF